MQNIFNLMLTVGQITIKINELLEVTFIDGNKPSKSCIGKSLKDVLMFYNKGDFAKSEFEIGKLLLLIRDLNLIKNNKLEMFNYFKKIILNDVANYDQYFGIRFEISIAASLISQSVNFEKVDPPLADFYANNYDIYIECGSRHLRIVDKKVSFIEALIKVIKEKSKKAYSVESNALFLDITNIYHHFINTGQIDIQKLINEELSQKISKSKFGSFVFFIFMHNLDTNTFEQNFIRLDSLKIEDKLKNFLDIYFPLGSYRVFKFGVSNNV